MTQRCCTIHSHNPKNSQIEMISTMSINRIQCPSTKQCSHTSCSYKEKIELLRYKQRLYQRPNQHVVKSSQAHQNYRQGKRSSGFLAKAVSQRNSDNTNIGSAAELIDCEVWDQKGKFIGVVESVSLLLSPCDLSFEVDFVLHMPILGAETCIHSDLSYTTSMNVWA